MMDNKLQHNTEQILNNSERPFLLNTIPDE